MNNLLKTELLNLLTGDQLVPNIEMNFAYDDFVTPLKAIIKSETDSSEIFRILNFTRIEFRT